MSNESLEIVLNHIAVKKVNKILLKALKVLDINFQIVMNFYKFEKLVLVTFFREILKNVTLLNLSVHLTSISN